MFLDAVVDVDFHESKYIMCTASLECKAFIWDHNSSKQLRTLDQHFQPVTACSFLGSEEPFESCVATASEDGHVRIWDVRSPSLEVSLMQPRGHHPLSLAFSSNRNKARSCLASGTAGGAVYLWDLRRHQLLRSMNVSDEVQPNIVDADRTWASCVAFSPGGKCLAVGCSTGKVALFDMEEALMTNASTPELLCEHKCAVLDLAWGAPWPDQWPQITGADEYLVCASADGTWSCWA